MYRISYAKERRLTENHPFHAEQQEYRDRGQMISQVRVVEVPVHDDHRYDGLHGVYDHLHEHGGHEHFRKFNACQKKKKKKK